MSVKTERERDGGREGERGGWRNIRGERDSQGGRGERGNEYV